MPRFNQQMNDETNQRNTRPAPKLPAKLREEQELMREAKRRQNVDARFRKLLQRNSRRR